MRSSTRRSSLQVARKVVRLRKDGMSWRKIERRLRLNPAHGMTAVRASLYVRAQGGRSSEPMTTPRILD